jgi:uncharacterized protein (TIGR02231 family)
MFIALELAGVSKNIQMKKILIFSCLLFTIYQSQSQALEISSQIASVTVYPKRAQVVRTAAVDLPQGKSELVFTQLSHQLISQSLRLTMGADNITVQEVSYRKNYLNAEALDKQKSGLYKQLDSLGQEEKWAAYEKEIIKGEETILNANQRVYSNEEGVSVEALRQLSTYYRTRLAELRRQQMDIDRRISNLRKQKQAVQNQINSLYASGQKVAGEVVVSIQAPQPVRTNIRLSYLVKNAGWSPAYDIKAISKEAPLEVTFRASVHQNTGQDWDGVKLSLSNASPATDNTQPQLNPLYARKAQGTLDTVANITPETYEETYRIVRNEPIAEEWSNTENKLTSTQYNLTQIDQIPSNGKKQTITVWKKQIPAKMQYLCIPRAAPYVYLLAEIADYGQYQLEPANANIYNEDTFIGTVDLASKGVADTLQISLGIDPSISVEREGRDFSEKKWLGADRKETYEFNLCLRNNKPEAVEVVLIDQIPVSTNKEIEIELLKKEGAQLNARTGSLQWAVKCKPDQTSCRSFTYSVKYPKEMKVSGRW